MEQLPLQSLLVLVFVSSVVSILRPPLPHPAPGQGQTLTFSTIDQDEAGPTSGGQETSFQSQLPINGDLNPGGSSNIQPPSLQLSPPLRPVAVAGPSQPPPGEGPPQSTNVITINGETFELLPPVEIPPTPDFSSSSSTANFNPAPVPASVVSSGSGSGSPDPGSDCIGSCDCPSDFNFVCGSNRFLYQNPCALACDQKCHPDVVQVALANCSRK